MDKTKRIVVVLLVLAIVFSVSSIFLSFGALNLDVPVRLTNAQGQSLGEGVGSLNLVVSGNSAEVNK